MTDESGLCSKCKMTEEERQRKLRSPTVAEKNEALTLIQYWIVNNVTTADTENHRKVWSKFNALENELRRQEKAP